MNTDDRVSEALVAYGMATTELAKDTLRLSPEDLARYRDGPYLMELRRAYETGGHVAVTRPVSDWLVRQTIQDDHEARRKWDRFTAAQRREEEAGHLAEVLDEQISLEEAGPATSG